MSAQDDTAIDVLATALNALKARSERPYGPAVAPDTRQLAGTACVRLCGGDKDKARALWKLVTDTTAGYMPQAAAIALIRASDTTNLVPDIDAPDPS